MTTFTELQQQKTLIMRLVNACRHMEHMHVQTLDEIDRKIAKRREIYAKTVETRKRKHNHAKKRREFKREFSPDVFSATAHLC